MLFKTHLAFGFLISLFAIDYFQPANQLLFAFILLFASAFPDIDHPNSKLGKKFRPISYLFEHRGFFHSFFGIALFTFTTYLISGSFLYSTAFLLGYASHILADAISDAGIMPFHPIFKMRLRGFFRTGAVYEYIIMLFLVVFSIWKLFIM